MAFFLAETICWLKGRFSTNPWIDRKDADVMAKIRSLTEKVPGEKGTAGMAIVYTYCANKLTQYRNQLRAKLVSNKETDIEGLSLNQLHNVLWRHFLPPSICLLDEERWHLTVMLRAFCARNRLFRSPGSVDFWNKFRQFYACMTQDSTQETWRRLTEKEERRIERYNSTLP